MAAEGVTDDAAVRISNLIFEHVARISRESGAGMAEARLLALNADLARDLTGADRCSLWLRDESRRQMWTRVAHGTSGEIRIPAGAGIVGQVFASGQPLIANDVGQDIHFAAMSDRESGYQTHSILAVPIRGGAGVVGVLQALNKPGGFTAADQELLTFMAVYTGSALESERLREQAEEARLLQREMDWAREVQSKLLPGAGGSRSGVECEALFRPARSVGGDYYDFIENANGTMTFTLGDVSGKGLPAAVLMASIQTLLRSQLGRSGDLGSQIAEASATLYECSSPDRYSTLFCGRLDRAAGQLTYVNAGQVAPFLLRHGTGTVERLSEASLPIGLLPGAHYRDACIGVGRGDVVLCVSDGFSEVLNQRDEIWDDVAIEQTLAAHAGAPLPELMRGLLERADEFAGGAEQHDDMTAVALRV